LNSNEVIVVTINNTFSNHDFFGLAFKYPESDIISALPTHAQIQKFVDVVIDFLKLIHSIEILVNNYVSVLKQNVFNYGNVQVLFVL
jgi:hypothetical protein